MADEIQCWMRLPGPEKMTDNICAVLTGRGTVWIQGSFSWADEVRYTIKDKLSTIDSGVDLEFLDASDLPENLSAEELIFLRDGSARKEYLPAMELASFVRQKQILPNTILWLYHLDGEKDRKWIDFSRALAKQGAKLKLVCEGAAVSGPAKNICLFRQDRCLSEFDYLLYAMTLLQKEKWSSDLKIYVSRLAVFLAGNDAERIAALLRRRGLLPEDPIRCARETMPDPDGDQIARAILSAQLMSLLPKVEMLRSQFISDAIDRFHTVIPFCDDYGNHITQPEDMELRHIVYFENGGQLTFDREEHALLQLLYRVRNGLSHRKIVDGPDAIACLEK